MKAADAGGSKPQEAAQDAASSVKDAVPDEPKQAAQDAVSAAKDSLPEPPKDIPNPFQNLFSGMHMCLCLCNSDHCFLGRRVLGLVYQISAAEQHSMRPRGDL